jgi:hypothetical protein
LRNKESVVPKRSWKEKRAGQGFSYAEVLEKMERCVRGVSIFTKEERQQRFRDGVKRLDRAYKLSALLNDFLEREEMTYKDLVALTGTIDHECTLELLLDPVSRAKRQRSLKKDYFVHCFYPGADVPFE